MTPKPLIAGDLAPSLDVELRYQDTSLTLDIPVGTTCKFSMKPVGSDTATIDDAAATVLSSAAGVVTVRYAWQTGQTDTPGQYVGEFNFPALNLSAPTHQPILIQIRPRVGDTP